MRYQVVGISLVIAWSSLSPVLALEVLSTHSDGPPAKFSIPEPPPSASCR